MDGLPLWLADPEWVGMNQAEVSRAEAAGLSHHPLEDTIRGTLDEAKTTDEAGINRSAKGAAGGMAGRLIATGLAALAFASPAAAQSTVLDEAAGGCAPTRSTSTPMPTH